MTDQQKKTVSEAADFLLKPGIGREYFKAGAEEVLNNPEKYGLVSFKDYREAVKERSEANKDFKEERKENARLFDALQVCHASLCTYGKHPIIDEQVSKALKGGTE